MFLDESCMDAYRKQYPEDSCGYLEPDDFFGIESGEINVIQPDDETNESFMDRLRRSREAGRNLFLTEWPENVYDPDVIL